MLWVLCCFVQTYSYRQCGGFTQLDTVNNLGYKDCASYRFFPSHSFADHNFFFPNKTVVVNPFKIISLTFTVEVLLPYVLQDFASSVLEETLIDDLQ